MINSRNPAHAAPALKQLHQLLIDPMHDALPTDPEAAVIFIPQDFLFFLPFPALINRENQYLIEHHTLLTSPSIQVLALTHHHHQRMSALWTEANSPAMVVGNPKMPQDEETLLAMVLSDYPDLLLLRVQPALWFRFGKSLMHQLLR